VNYKYILILLFVICAPYLGRAQNPVVIHLDETDGLPDVEFYDILEDSKGFIWLAADKGLYRYDGKVFKYYTNPDQQSRSVFHLFEDEQGRIWCNNVAGQFFYVEDDTLQLVANNSEKENVELSFFYVFENTLYISRKTNIEGYNLEDNSSKYIYETKASPPAMAEPYFDDGKFYMASLDGFGVLDKTLNYTPIVKNRLEFESNSRKLVFKDDKSFYVALRDLAENVVLRIDSKTGEYINIDIPKEIRFGALPVIKYEKGFLWVVSDNGLYKGTIKDDAFVVDQVFFKNQYITDVIHDRNGNLWITTFRDGVYVVPNSGLIRQDFMEDPSISAMTKYNDSILLFGTAKGRMIFYNVK